MKSLFEELGGTYTKAGDYYLPNISLPKTKPLGKYGRMRLKYLKEYRPALYASFLFEGTLFEYLEMHDENCNSRMEFLCKAMAEQEGVTEELKASDPMERVRRMNSIRSRAEENVLTELSISE